MAPLTIPAFAHRYHSSGIDSICSRCFTVVAKAQTEADLARLEREHVCDPLVVEMFKQRLASTRT